MNQGMTVWAFRILGAGAWVMAVLVGLESGHYPQSALESGALLENLAAMHFQMICTLLSCALGIVGTLFLGFAELLARR